MIRLKNERQLEGIRKSCWMLKAMYQELIPFVKPGVTTLDLDNWAKNWIKKAGGKPAFLGYGGRDNPFPGALCISINDEVIHGIPSKRRIAEGDLVSIDSGIDLGGFISDRSDTVEAGRVSDEAHRLNVIAKECLAGGIAAAAAGQRVLQISRAIFNHASEQGYGVVHQFCGHGVGFSLHEDPQVPNHPRGANPRLSGGMVLAIEPMINLGTGDVKVLADGWTVVTADGRPSAHWEHTIAIHKDHTEILTL